MSDSERVKNKRRGANCVCCEIVWHLRFLDTDPRMEYDCTITMLPGVQGFALSKAGYVSLRQGEVQMPTKRHVHLPITALSRKQLSEVAFQHLFHHGHHLGSRLIVLWLLQRRAGIPSLHRLK